jgi:transposase InsO family protein
MVRKRFNSEQIVTKLRQIEVLQSQGKALAVACREAELSEQLRDECLNSEIFYSLKDAQTVIAESKRHYNTRRPRSATGPRR